MNELPKPPAPDTHCWDDDTRLDVWSHSAYQLNQYGAECYRKALEDAAKVPEAMCPAGGRAWSEPQLACFEALTDCAAAIRGMK